MRKNRLHPLLNVRRNHESFRGLSAIKPFNLVKNNGCVQIFGAQRTSEFEMVNCYRIQAAKYKLLGFVGFSQKDRFANLVEDLLVIGRVFIWDVIRGTVSLTNTSFYKI